MCRGVRGATVVGSDSQEEILLWTRRLLTLIVRTNDIDPADITSILFTTSDLSAEFPAMAARQIFKEHSIPLLCAQELQVPRAVSNCVRVLLHWNTDKPQSEIKAVYINGAEKVFQSVVPDYDEEELEAWVNSQLPQ